MRSHSSCHGVSIPTTRVVRPDDHGWRAWARVITSSSCVGPLRFYSPESTRNRALTQTGYSTLLIECNGRPWDNVANSNGSKNQTYQFPICLTVASTSTSSVRRFRRSYGRCPQPSLPKPRARCLWLGCRIWNLACFVVVAIVVCFDGVGTHGLVPVSRSPWSLRGCSESFGCSGGGLAGGGSVSVLGSIGGL